MSRIQKVFFVLVFFLTGFMQWLLLREDPRFEVAATLETKHALLQSVGNSLEQKGVMRAISKADRSISSVIKSEVTFPEESEGNLDELFERSKDPYLAETMIARIQSNPRGVMRALNEMGHDPARRAAAIDGLVLFARFSPDPGPAREELQFQISRLDPATDLGEADLEISFRNAKGFLESSAGT